MRSDLEKIFNFDEADLLINQNGQLSEKQLRMISDYRQTGKFFGRLAFIVMFVSIGGLCFIALYHIGIDWQNNPEPIIAYAVFFSVSFLIFIFSILLGKLRSDLKSGEISTVAGFAEKKEKEISRRLGTAYYVTIGNVKFQLDGIAKYRAIESNITYRVFYIKHPPTHIILSIAEMPVSV